MSCLLNLWAILVLSWVAGRAERAPWRPRAHCKSTRWWGAACPPQMPHSTLLLHAEICTWSCGHQVPLLALSKEDEVFRGNCWLQTGVGEISLVGKERRHPAVLSLPQGLPQHRPGADRCRRSHPVLWDVDTGTTLGPLKPDHEGEGDCSPQVPPTNRQAVSGLQDQVPAASLGPAWPGQARLHHQEARHLLLDA